MRILQITPYGRKKIGGTEVACANLCKELASRGVDVTCATDGETYEPIPGVRHVGMRRAFRWLHRGDWAQMLDCWTPRSMRLLRGEIARHDVVHVHDMRHPGTLLALRWAFLAGIPTVVTDHLGEGPAPWWRAPFNPLRRRIRMYALNNATAAVYVAKHVQGADAGRIRRETRVIECGIDPAVFHPDGSQPSETRRGLGWEERPTILFVGRFCSQKRLSVLKLLARMHREWTWVFVGAGKEDPRRWNLPNVRVFSTHDSRTIATYYRAADALVLPTRSEGLPLCALEALGCGTPVMISGVVRPADHFPEGTFVEVADDADDEPAAEAWSAALESMLAPEALREIRGVVLHKPANLTWGRMAERYMALYESIAGKHR